MTMNTTTDMSLTVKSTLNRKPWFLIAAAKHMITQGARDIHTTITMKASISMDQKVALIITSTTILPPILTATMKSAFFQVIPISRKK